MFSASVWADIWGPESSTLDVSGGSKLRPDGGHDFLIWAMPHDLAAGDSVEFNFEHGATSDPKGVIFKTENPSAPASAKTGASWPPSEVEMLEWESRVAKNAGLTWTFVLNGAAPICVCPDASRQHVSLHLLWNEERHDRLRVSLSKSSLRDIGDRTGGEELLLEYAPLSSRIQVVVGA